jgi:hypothetical protein
MVNGWSFIIIELVDLNESVVLISIATGGWKGKRELCHVWGFPNGWSFIIIEFDLKQNNKEKQL